MSYITNVTLKNYRSFREARCHLSPFTLVVGANNAGKSNLLKAVRDLAACTSPATSVAVLNTARHHASERDARTEITLDWSDGKSASAWNERGRKRTARLLNIDSQVSPLDGIALEIYSLNADIIGSGEGGSGEPYIAPTGAGVSWMLDKWNSGARSRRARFEKVIGALRRCVPEIEAVSFYDQDNGKRAIQVEQTGLPAPCPLSEVSDGTRLVLALLTLVHQESPPPVLLLEDIDRSLHPRLYEQLVSLLKELAKSGHAQIIATTHDPYLIDEFRDNPEAVVIVEKKDGISTLSNLNDRLVAIQGVDKELEMPLGELWFRGFVGGVPQMRLPAIFGTKTP